MPQFDPTHFPSQLFWLVITFLVLYWIVARYAIPRIGDILEQRERVIQDDLDRAEGLKSEAEEALAAYEAAMTEARDQAREMLRQMQDEAKAAADARNKEVGDELNAQIREAEARIAKARDEAMAGVRGIAAEAAKDAASRLAGVDVTADQAEAAASDAMKGTH